MEQGICGYKNKTIKDEDGYELYEPLWKVDCNEPRCRKDKEEENSLPSSGPSELIGTPVLYKDKIYCAIDGTGAGDRVGRYLADAKNKCIGNTDVGRTISTVSVADD